jgi:putative transport protein
MLDVLADNPVLTLFLVVGLGSALGLVPFGPIRFGPAGALFVGLALGATDDRLGEDLGLARTIGLALFVYTVGLSSGSILIRTFRRQLPLMAGSALVLGVVGAGTLLLGRLLDLSAGFQGGAFAGVGTSTPTLAAATVAVGGGTEPAVGYALTYPLGVVFGIIAVHLEMGRRRVTPRDPGSAAVAGLTDLTVVVGRRARLAEVPGAAEELVRFSYWRHGRSVEVASGDTVVEPGDQVVVVGGQEAVAAAVGWLGTRADEHLAHDRRQVDYRRVLLSNARLAGSTVAELDVGGRFGAVVTRVRRGDLDLLARDDLHVLLGDRLRVVVPRGRMAEVTRYLGDTERRVSEVDAVSLGLGLSLGFLLGLLSLPLGSVTLSLGVAAGPLVAGIVLGWLERTGPIVWSLPTGASLTLRQLGVLVFLAAVGLSSGSALADSLGEPVGRKLLLAGALLAVVGPALLTLLTHRLGMSPTRSGGLIAGFVGNPSLLAFATGRVADERVNEGYATLFALDTILKVLLVQVIVGVGGG